MTCKGGRPVGGQPFIPLFYAFLLLATTGGGHCLPLRGLGDLNKFAGVHRFPLVSIGHWTVSAVLLPTPDAQDRPQLVPSVL